MSDRVRRSIHALRLLLVAVAVSFAACGDDDHAGVPQTRVDAGDSGEPRQEGGRGGAAGTGQAGNSAPVDAGTRDAQSDEDAGPVRCNDRKCEQMSDACNMASCNHATETCELHPRMNGTACGDATDDRCTDPDTCVAGKCVANHQPSGVACGDQAVACHNVDECDGQGHCIDHGLMAEGTACGDGSNNACDHPDTCDAHGQCASNYAPAATACGDQSIACRNDDSCDGHGVCVDQGVLAAGTSCSTRNIPLGACHLAPDVCDAAGNCVLGDAADGTTCGSATTTECDHADSCLAGVCEANLMVSGTACGNPSESACDHADQCNGLGACLPRKEFIGAPCGTQSNPCMLADACDSNGQCVSGGPAVASTPCGSPMQSTCTAPDSCDGSGTCLPNHALIDTVCSLESRDCRDADRCDGAGSCQLGTAFPAGTACGDPADDECNHADSCNDGTCQPNYAAQGTVCGEHGVACRSDDTCNAVGVCDVGGPLDPCTGAITGTVVSSGSAALPGITVEAVGNNASTQSDGTGHFSLNVPFNTPVTLHFHESSGYWGQIATRTFTPGSTTADATLSSDANLGNFTGMVGGLPALDTGKAVVRIVFRGYSGSGGETATLSASSAPAFTDGSSGLTLASSLEDGGGSYLGFINAVPGSSTVSAHGVDGTNTCTPSMNTILLVAHTITDTVINCSDE